MLPHYIGWDGEHFCMLVFNLNENSTREIPYNTEIIYNTEITYNTKIP